MVSVGFIGGGAMATALASGFISANLVSSVIISDPNMSQLNRLRKQLNSNIVTLTQNNEDICRSAQVVFLAIKPQIVDVVMKDIQRFLTPNHLLISICAGTSIHKLSSYAPCRIVRVMPNTPALVGAMAAGFASGPTATPQDISLVEKLLSSLGVVERVPEKLLDAVTGLSGSGPAYVFIFIEALADGGVKAGLPRSVALKLATQTVLGAAKLQQETGDHPGVLKDRVTSPGGTTIAGVYALEENAFRSSVMKAVVEASKRSKELSKL